MLQGSDGLRPFCCDADDEGLGISRDEDDFCCPFPEHLEIVAGGVGKSIELSPLVDDIVGSSTVPRIREPVNILRMPSPTNFLDLVDARTGREGVVSGVANPSCGVEETAEVAIATSSLVGVGRKKGDMDLIFEAERLDLEEVRERMDKVRVGAAKGSMTSAVLAWLNMMYGSACTDEPRPSEGRRGSQEGMESVKGEADVAVVARARRKGPEL